MTISFCVKLSSCCVCIKHNFDNCSSIFLYTPPLFEPNPYQLPNPFSCCCIEGLSILSNQIINKKKDLCTYTFLPTQVANKVNVKENQLNALTLLIASLIQVILFFCSFLPILT